jgi:hypothetical protein
MPSPRFIKAQHSCASDVSAPNATRARGLNALLGRMSSADELAKQVGHPQTLWDELKSRVQDENVKQFSAVEQEWLALMWALDAFRTAGLAPPGVGNLSKPEAKRLEAFYRGKGNWFATLLALLLENQTTHRLAPRVRVQGFSQFHQIDVAWPDREVDPLICLETKVTGAPSTRSDPERGAMADWTNRRKELKFAATDLKLFRRQHLTSIEHWDVWRAGQYPKTYFLWAARLRDRDDPQKMVSEAQALVKTYLEGAGVYAWRSTGGGYVPVALPALDRVSSVDDVLYRIASELRQLAPSGQAPPPQLPTDRALSTGDLPGE